DLWQTLLLSAISVCPYDGPHSIIDLPFITMRCRLDLAALITQFGRRPDASKLFDLAEFIQNLALEHPFENFHSGRACQSIHHQFEQAGFLEDDCLGVCRQPYVFFAWGGKRFVSTVAVTGVRGISIRKQQLNGSTCEIVLKLMGNKRTAA